MPSSPPRSRDRSASPVRSSEAKPPKNLDIYKKKPSSSASGPSRSSGRDQHDDARYDRSRLSSGRDDSNYRSRSERHGERDGGRGPLREKDDRRPRGGEYRDYRDDRGSRDTRDSRDDYRGSSSSYSRDLRDRDGPSSRSAPAPPAPSSAPLTSAGGGPPVRAPAPVAAMCVHSLLAILSRIASL